MVIVGVDRCHPVEQVDLFLVGLGILLAEVPIEGEVVTEAGNDLAKVEPTLGAGLTGIDGFGNTLE